VLAEIERRPAHEPDEPARVEALRVLAYAHGQRERKISCTDIWAYLARTTTGKLVESGDLTSHALLFTLVHGMPEPAATLPDRIDVNVVMRNDDYTTREFVVKVLVDEFEDVDPEPKMMQVHNEGRGVVGRYKSQLAAMKIDAVRRRAREHMFPLWIAPEDT
jgi:ATP-dependent Clp protease adaptor protein ClpS